jgi:hypothetical protein
VLLFDWLAPELCWEHSVPEGVWSFADPFEERREFLKGFKAFSFSGSVTPVFSLLGPVHWES